MSHFHGIELPPETIRDACAGRAAAHEAIYRAFQRPVYTLIRRLIPRPAVADELLQEVFMEILRSVRGYSAEGSFAGWVRSITVNKCLMYLRSPWHRRLFWLDAQEEGSSMILPDGEPSPSIRNDVRADLQRALDELSPAARSVVWLHDVEGYTHGEIAKLLGRTPSFSKSQLSRAHLKLRELLDSPAETLSCTPISTNC